MNALIESVLNWRFWSLALKELRQIRRNRQLVIFLTIPPAMQMMLFGFALNPLVTHMKIGVVDESRTPESRELVSQFTENQVFDLAGYYVSPAELERALTVGELDLGLVVPRKYAEQRVRRESADVQILLNGVNSNTAATAQGYASRILGEINGKLAAEYRRAGGTQSTLPRMGRATLQTHVSLLFNPGLVPAWYIVTGTFGVTIVLNSILVSSAVLMKEKDAGTVEQLLMTPASTFSIIAAKIVPLSGMMMTTATIILTLVLTVFGVPMRGNVLLIFLAAALCGLAGIGIGAFISTLSRNAQQAQLLSFFVIPPLAMLSGSITPIEAMPKAVQLMTALNPVTHFVAIVRSVMIKGTGADVVAGHYLGLLALAVVLLSVSVARYRRQLN